MESAFCVLTSVARASLDKIIAPKVHIVVGISNAIQHWAEMRESMDSNAFARDESAPLMILGWLWSGVSAGSDRSEARRTGAMRGLLGMASVGKTKTFGASGQIGYSIFSRGGLGLVTMKLSGSSQRARYVSR